MFSIVSEIIQYIIHSSFCFSLDLKCKFMSQVSVTWHFQLMEPTQGLKCTHRHLCTHVYCTREPTQTHNIKIMTFPVSKPLLPLLLSGDAWFMESVFVSVWDTQDSTVRMKTCLSSVSFCYVCLLYGLQHPSSSTSIFFSVYIQCLQSIHFKPLSSLFFFSLSQRQFLPLNMSFSLYSFLYYHHVSCYQKSVYVCVCCVRVCSCVYAHD